MITPPPAPLVRRVLAAALEEDLGTAGDLTTEAIVAPDTVARAAVVARDGGRVAGLEVGFTVFPLLGATVETTVHVADGEDAAAGAVLAELAGPAQALLTGERTFLNVLGHLSGIATATRDLVNTVAGTGVTVADTRKTTPGLRALEKYAVRLGGGRNHRSGLHDAVMIKDNHLAIAGSLAAAVEAVHRRRGHTTTVVLEVDTLEQIDEALAVGVDVLLLDNMTPAELTAAVARVGGRAVTEASGNVTADNIREIAATGVDVVSVGWITHSAPRRDVALDFAAS